MRNKRIAIVGKGRAGKDLSGSTLGKYTALRYVGSTSSVICPMIAAELGITPEEAWNDRHNNRMFWYKWANNYRKYDPARIIRTSLSVGDMVVGIRDKLEIEAMINENLVDLIIWIERDVPDDPTLTFDRSYADIVIDNNGDLANLERKLKRLADFANLPRSCKFEG